MKFFLALSTLPVLFLSISIAEVHAQESSPVNETEAEVTETSADLGQSGSNAEPPATQSSDSLFRSNGDREEEDLYILGGSDEISIRFAQMPEDFLDQDRFIIPIDGYLNLPWVGQVRLEGLTIPQAENLIASRYSEYVYDPMVTITLISPRSLRVAVAGEVERPGSYTLTPREEGISGGLVEVGGNPNDWPTVVTAIQAAGGLQQRADLRDVQIRRIQQDGSERRINVNLWQILQGEGLDQVVSLRDGDTVFIPTATSIDLGDSQQIAIANFSPDAIAVNVAGEIKQPGAVELEPNASLNQAILAAGGFTDARANTGTVNLIRLNPDGTVVNREIPVNYSDPLNEETNPILQDNDIVVVSRTGLAGSTDFLELLGSFVNSIINPIGGVVDLIETFDNLNDDDDDND